MTHDPHGDLDAILADPRALLDDGGPPLVLATNAELLHVLEGRDLTFAATDGTEVRIRLYNPDELLAAQRTARADWMHADPGMSREQAIELCQPLGLALARMGYRRWRTS